MKITTFTDTMIRKLKPKDRKYIRGEGNGFSIRVMPSGVKTWLYVYSLDNRREFNLGAYPDVTLETARRRFDDARKKVKNGIDPMAEKELAELERQNTPNVSDFVTEYIENYAKKHNKGWKEIERALKANVVSKWGKRKVTDIRRRDLVLLLDEIEKRAPIMANRTLAYTRKLFSYAVKRDVLEANPFMGMEAPAPARVRDRNLSFSEIKTLWTNLDKSKISRDVKRVLRLMLVTGQRPGEVIGMHSSEIDGRWWTVPEVRSKNKLAHRVYLTDLAVEIIGNKEGYIFESPVNIGTPLEVRTLTKAIKANLPHKPESRVTDYLKIQYFVPHDLRRTFTSRMAELGTSDDMLDRVQNHMTVVKKGVRKNYNHYTYDKEKRIILEAWEQEIVRIISVD